MKKIFKIATILFVVAVIFSCRKEPEIPEPATPKGLSYQIQDGSILFSWFPAKDALTYGIEVASDAELSDLVFTREGIEDTFLLISCDSFVADSTYYWRVRAEGEADWSAWSETMEFSLAEQLIALDLDTTYFPFGLGYEWCYEYHKNGWEDGPTEPIYYDEYDTITFSVLDSTWNDDTLIFELSDGIILLGDKVKVFRNRIFIHSSLVTLIDITPDEFVADSTESHTYSEEYWKFLIEYDIDTLVITSSYRHYDTEIGSHWSCSDIYGIRCLEKIGIVFQFHSSNDGYFLGIKNPDHSISNTYRLLWFYNGVDTVYKSPDWK